MGTELCPECRHPTKVYADAGNREHFPECSFYVTWRHTDGTVRIDHMDARPGDYFGTAKSQ